MSRRRELLEAELALIDAEETFRAAKEAHAAEVCKTCGRPVAGSEVPEGLTRAKAEMREARRAYRELRAELGSPEGTTVMPATVGAKARAPKPGNG